MSNNLDALKFWNSLVGSTSFDSEKKEAYFSDIESAKLFKMNFPDFSTYYKVEIK